MTREEACKKAQIIDFQGGYTIALVTGIYNDHEAQLKAKDEEIERLKGKTQILEVLVDNTKDIIEAQTRMCKTKARSIVAMLFWEWKKDKRLSNS